MYEVPWNEYRVAGYRGFGISHLDGNPITDDEKTALDEEVNEDLFFDYGDEELQVWFTEIKVDAENVTAVWFHVQEN